MSQKPCKESALRRSRRCGGGNYKYQTLLRGQTSCREREGHWIWDRCDACDHMNQSPSP